VEERWKESGKKAEWRRKEGGRKAGGRRKEGRRWAEGKGKKIKRKLVKKVLRTAVEREKEGERERKEG
jgi:hypothetical protein